VGLGLILVWHFMNEVTQILSAVAGGDSHAGSQLLPLVYDELRKLAAQRLAGEKPGQTLQATALVHEAYLRLVGADDEQSWESRGHFFAAAAEAMRRILVEHARARSADKRGGRLKRVELADWHNVAQPPEQILALNEALERLVALDPQKAKLVTLRYFGGLSLPEAANALGISLRTAERWWHFARSWLYAQLVDDNE
jgi:RNA polymerase sigma factor (TIGR02999 family)